MAGSWLYIPVFWWLYTAVIWVLSLNLHCHAWRQSHRSSSGHLHSPRPPWHQGWKISAAVLKVFLQISHPTLFHCLTIMSSDQCALNPNGSLKDTKDIQWFNDLDDAHPLPNPTSTALAQPLGQGRCNKTANWFLDTVAREQLDSDQELNSFIQPSKSKHAVCHGALNISNSSACPPPLASSNSFKVLLVEQSSDDEDDGSFKSDCGSESGDDSSDDSTPELAQISNDEVRVQHFSHNLKCLWDTFAACQRSAKENSCWP